VIREKGFYMRAPFPPLHSLRNGIDESSERRLKKYADVCTISNIKRTTRFSL
jgi:hypothetical protein